APVPPKPVAPPFPFKYAGWVQEGHGPAKVYLSRGDAVFPVKPGDVLEGFRIDAVHDERIEVTYLASGEQSSRALANLTQPADEPGITTGGLLQQTTPLPIPSTQSPVITNPVQQLQQQLQRQQQAQPAAKPAGEPAAAERNEFQEFIAASTGKKLPIFGFNLFEAPTTFAPVENIPVTGDYVIGPGDELLVRAWGQIDVDFRAVVDRNGMVNIPRVGS